MPTRTVTGQLQSGNCSGKSVEFEFVGTPDADRPANTQGLIDSFGRFAVGLWCDLEGFPPSRYYCRYPDGNRVSLFVPYGTNAIPIEAITEGPAPVFSVSPTPQEIFSDLLRQHDQQIDAHGQMRSQMEALMAEVLELQEDYADVARLIHSMDGLGKDQELWQRLEKSIERLRQKTKSWSRQ